MASGPALEVTRPEKRHRGTAGGDGGPGPAGGSLGSVLAANLNTYPSLRGVQREHPESDSTKPPPREAPRCGTPFKHVAFQQKGRNKRHLHDTGHFLQPHNEEILPVQEWRWAPPVPRHCFLFFFRSLMVAPKLPRGNMKMVSISEGFVQCAQTAPLKDLE